MSAASSFIVHFPSGSTCKHNKIKQPNLTFASGNYIFLCVAYLFCTLHPPRLHVRTLSLPNDAEKQSLLMDTLPLPKDSAIASALARALPTT